MEIDAELLDEILDEFIWEWENDSNENTKRQVTLAKEIRKMIAKYDKVALFETPFK